MEGRIPSERGGETRPSRGRNDPCTGAWLDNVGGRRKHKWVCTEPGGPRAEHRGGGPTRSLLTGGGPGLLSSSVRAHHKASVHFLFFFF